MLKPGAALFRDFVEARGELEWIEPLGGSVGFPRISGVHSADAFVAFAESEHGVGVTPGGYFGQPAHFRVAVAGPFDMLERGLQALGAALDDWGG